jgi:putative flippase GtrA
MGGVCMKFKPFILSFCTFVVSTSVLYGIGYLFNISILMFHYEYTNNKSGLFIEAGSILPFVIGFILSFIMEKLYISKQKSI